MINITYSFEVFFEELASSEASRLAEIKSIFNPTRRYNCIAFTEKATWRDFLELFPDIAEVGNDFFERCVGDGSRDYGGRILSNPIHPQVRLRSVDVILYHHILINYSSITLGLNKVFKIYSEADGSFIEFSPVALRL